MPSQVASSVPRARWHLALVARAYPLKLWSPLPRPLGMPGPGYSPRLAWWARMGALLAPSPPWPASEVPPPALC